MSEVHQSQMRYLGTLSNPGDKAIAQAIAGLKSGARVVPSYLKNAFLGLINVPNSL